MIRAGTSREDAESVVLGGLEKLGYCNVTEDLLRREHENPGLLAIEIADKHELRLEMREWQGQTLYKFTRIE